MTAPPMIPPPAPPAPFVEGAIAMLRRRLDLLSTRWLIILASVVAVITVIALTAAIVVLANIERGPFGETKLSDLRDGDCLASLDWAGSVSTTVERVPCSTPHAAELIHEGDMRIEFDSYPGQTRSADFASTSCATANTYHLHVSAATAELPHATVRSVYVGAPDWKTDPYFRCFLVLDDGSMLRGSYFDPSDG